MCIVALQRFCPSWYMIQWWTDWVVWCQKRKWLGLSVLWDVQLKETVQEKFMSEEALEEKRREEARALARKKRWGPFGIFPGGK